MVINPYTGISNNGHVGVVTKVTDSTTFEIIALNDTYNNDYTYTKRNITSSSNYYKNSAGFIYYKLDKIIIPSGYIIKN
jgi:hypothetical protein